MCIRDRRERERDREIQPEQLKKPKLSENIPFLNDLNVPLYYHNYNIILINAIFQVILIYMSDFFTNSKWEIYVICKNVSNLRGCIFHDFDTLTNIGENGCMQ